MLDNSQADVSSAAKKLLKDGKLLETTEALAFKVSNKYDFARRFAREYSLILAGQTIKYLNVGQLDRAYSHVGLYAPPGLGKDYAWKLVQTSGIFPTDVFRVKKIENVTEAALAGTITESTLIPPPTVTEDILFVGEYATLVRGNIATAISADLRAILESGEYSRRVAKIGRLKEIIHTQPSSPQAKYVQEQIREYKKLGMTIDLTKCEINVKTTTSWIVSSAKFGSETYYGRSLLNMGDVNRYRWLSYVPTREERLRITSEVGSLPPVTISAQEKKVCREAWAVLVKGLRTHIVEIPRDSQSYYERQRIWDDTQKTLMDTYRDEMANDIYFNQIVNMRTRAEFTRLMYQHAVLKQYERDQGYDFTQPHKFIIDYKEDGEFAKQLWISEYVPSMIDVVKDVLKHPDAKIKSTRETLTAKGEAIVIEKLKKGPAKREELLKLLSGYGISVYLLDNRILRKLITQGTIVRNHFGWYSLTVDLNKRQISIEDTVKKIQQ